MSTYCKDCVRYEMCSSLMLEWYTACALGIRGCCEHYEKAEQECDDATETREKLKSFEDSVGDVEIGTLIEDVLDTLLESGNGVTNEDYHEAADKLFKVRDILTKNGIIISYQIADNDSSEKTYKHSKLVELPCEVGDTVYIPQRKRVSVHKVSSIIIGVNNILCIKATPIIGYLVPCFFIDDIGNKVFLTKEEAEQALKREEGKNDKLRKD